MNRAHDSRRAALRLRRLRRNKRRPGSGLINISALFPAPLPAAPDHMATMQSYIQTVVQTIGGAANPLFRHVMSAVEDMLTYATDPTGSSSAAVALAKERTLQAIRDAMAVKPAVAAGFAALAGPPSFHPRAPASLRSEASPSPPPLLRSEAAVPPLLRSEASPSPPPLQRSEAAVPPLQRSEASPSPPPLLRSATPSTANRSKEESSLRGSGRSRPEGLLRSARSPKERFEVQASFNPRDRTGGPKWQEGGPRQSSSLGCAPSFSPQFEAHLCVANAFADLEEVLGRYASRRASRFLAFLRRRPEFPVVLSRLPFVAVEQLLLAISCHSFHELFVWFAELIDPRYTASSAWRPPLQTFRRGETGEGARLRFEGQAPREAPDEILLTDQFTQPAAVTLSSEVNIYDWRGGLRVRSGRFSALLERLAAKYGPRGEDLLDLAYQLLAKAAKKQTAFVAVYVGPAGAAGETPCGTREPAPEFRAQRVFEWRVLGRLTPPSCYQLLTVLPLGEAGERSEAGPPRSSSTRELRLSARVSATVCSDAFRSEVIKRFVVATEDRIGGRVVRIYLLGETDIPFVSIFVRPQCAVPADTYQMPPELRGADPADLVMIQYELEPLRDAPWTNVAFTETPSPAPRPGPT